MDFTASRSVEGFQTCILTLLEGLQDPSEVSATAVLVLSVCARRCDSVTYNLIVKGVALHAFWNFQDSLYLPLLEVTTTLNRVTF